ncbi:hypothetical protein KKI24_27755, partial [bacterium]|nr:hypothetical protein [bacterium]
MKKISIAVVAVFLIVGCSPSMDDIARQMSLDIKRTSEIVKEAEAKHGEQLNKLYTEIRKQDKRINVLEKESAYSVKILPGYNGLAWWSSLGQVQNIYGSLEIDPDTTTSPEFPGIVFSSYQKFYGKGSPIIFR